MNLGATDVGDRVANAKPVRLRDRAHPCDSGRPDAENAATGLPGRQEGNGADTAAPEARP